MSVPAFSQIKPGTLVSIVLKQDQRTGRRVQGSVAQTLTRGDHPRGVKVRLSDGRIGRVQELIGGIATPSSNLPPKHFRKMADQNPWASDAQGDPWQNSNYQAQQNTQYGTTGGGSTQSRFYGEYNQQQQQQQQRQPDLPSPQRNYLPSLHNTTYSSDQPYQGSPYQPPSSNSNPWSDAPSANPPLPARHPEHNFSQSQSQPHSSSQYNSPPTAPIRRDTDDLLASQEDGAEQMEHLQAYEATANRSEDDRNRAQLEKEFPNVDGSLIAALYSDTRDLSATRELLQELGRS